MESFTQGLYPVSALIFIMAAVFIFAFFRLFKYLLQFIRIPRPQGDFVLRYLPVAELTAWVLFFIWGIQYLFKRGFLLTLIPLIVFIIIIIYLSWFALRDIIAGVVFKTGSSLMVNDHVNLTGTSGKVTAIKLRNLEIEDYSGQMVSIPYSKIVGQVIRKSYPSQSLLSHNFIFRIPAQTGVDLFQCMENMRTDILTLPWSSQKKDPKISIEEETPQHILYNITVFSLDEAYFKKTEKFLEEEYKGKVLPKK